MRCPYHYETERVPYKKGFKAPVLAAFVQSHSRLSQGCTPRTLHLRALGPPLSPRVATYPAPMKQGPPTQVESHHGGCLTPTCMITHG